MYEAPAQLLRICVDQHLLPTLPSPLSYPSLTLQTCAPAVSTHQECGGREDDPSRVCWGRRSIGCPRYMSTVLHLRCSVSLNPTLHYRVFGLTVVDAIGHTSTALSIDVADILLQARSRYTTRSLRNRAVCVGALGHGSREGGYGEDDGGSGELHFRTLGIVDIDWSWSWWQKS
jgi:hypothetical protein